jgi:hypothetical protein
MDGASCIGFRDWKMCFRSMELCDAGSSNVIYSFILKHLVHLNILLEDCCFVLCNSC